MIVTDYSLMIASTFGLMYSYIDFFNPVADYFDLNRAKVSMIYSASLIIQGTSR
jgi:hypothetical protein